MRRLLSLLSLVLLAGSFAGCRIGRYYLTEPVTDQFIEVKSGDRVYVELEENSTTGYQWSATVDDERIELGIEHLPPEANGELYGRAGLARVMIRVHRGFFGPAAVELKYARSWSDEVARTVTIGLYRRPTDVANWK